STARESGRRPHGALPVVPGSLSGRGCPARTGRVVLLDRAPRPLPGRTKGGGALTASSECWVLSPFRRLPAVVDGGSAGYPSRTGVRQGERATLGIGRLTASWGCGQDVLPFLILRTDQRDGVEPLAAEI